ncbi:HAD family hydrolase [Agrobacterium sp. NPDC089420]|uniref:HAD family hydrolase n=1 Tax=Agrobacterium sp. NPDC089420 TaxID=3363918 RepID=UPI00384B0EE6
MSTPKLIAFDVDGTLLRGENICGCIARNIGRTAEMDAFELFRSREEITAGRQKMLEWYAPYNRATLIEYLQEVRLVSGVRSGFARLKDEGIKIALVSITWKFAVEWLAADLGADYAIGTGWEDGEIAHFWPEDKAIWLQTLMAELQIDRDSLVAVGDSHGDIPMLQLAKRSYFVGAVLPPELRHVNHWPDADIEAIVNDALQHLSRKP